MRVILTYCLCFVTALPVPSQTALFLNMGLQVREDAVQWDAFPLKVQGGCSAETGLNLRLFGFLEIGLEAGASVILPSDYAGGFAYRALEEAFAGASLGLRIRLSDLWSLTASGAIQAVLARYTLTPTLWGFFRSGAALSAAFRLNEFLELCAGVPVTWDFDPSGQIRLSVRQSVSLGARLF